MWYRRVSIRHGWTQCKEEDNHSRPRLEERECWLYNDSSTILQDLGFLGSVVWLRSEEETPLNRVWFPAYGAIYSECTSCSCCMTMTAWSDPRKTKAGHYFSEATGNDWGIWCKLRKKLRQQQSRKHCRSSNQRTPMQDDDMTISEDEVDLEKSSAKFHVEHLYFYLVIKRILFFNNQTLCIIQCNWDPHRYWRQLSSYVMFNYAHINWTSSNTAGALQGRGGLQSAMVSCRVVKFSTFACFIMWDKLRG